MATGTKYTDEPALTFDTGEAIEQYRMMRLNSSKAWVYADAGEMPMAVSREKIASGLPLCGILLRNKPGTIKAVSAGTVAFADRVYAANDGKVSATNTGVLIGYALKAGSAGSVIEVLPALQRVPYANVASSTGLVAADTNATPFDVSYTIPASEIKAGMLIKIRAWGIQVDENSTNTCTITVKLGTETIVASAAVDAVDNDQFLLEADVVVRTVGASGTLVASGKAVNDAAGTLIGVANKAEAVEDMTSGLAVTVTATWSAAHADNEARLDGLIVELLNR